MRLGLISDTHGLLRPEVFAAFEGIDRILHAGDIGDADILLALEAVAPVTAVWGNTDGWDMRRRLPEVARLEVGGVAVKVIHGHQHGSPSGRQMAADHQDVGLVVFGHSHRPEIERVGAVLAVNPGSAGPGRFDLPTSVAIATVSDAGVDARLVHLGRRQSADDAMNAVE